MMQIIQDIKRQIRVRFKYFIRLVRVRLHLYKNKRYWRNYYKNHRDNDIPSSFAIFCYDNYLQEAKNLLELGCGNGRDAFFYARKKINVLALDLENEEIAYLNSKNKYKNLKFLGRNFVTFSSEDKFDAIYSRFTIHSICENDENRTLKNSYENLKPNGLLLIEVRSIKDEMFLSSTKVSDNEGVTDHYRRFIDFENLKNKLINLNYEIIYSVESKGLAVYKNEDPMIIRIIAKKTS